MTMYRERIPESATLFTTRRENHSRDFKRRSLIKSILKASQHFLYDLLPFPSLAGFCQRKRNPRSRPLARRSVLFYTSSYTGELCSRSTRRIGSVFTEVDGYYALRGIGRETKEMQESVPCRISMFVASWIPRKTPE